MSGQRTPDDSSDRVPQCVVVRRDERRLQKQAERRSKKRDEIKKEIDGDLDRRVRGQIFRFGRACPKQNQKRPLLSFLEGTVNVVQRKND
jgi:hypothetical protein